MIEPGHKVIVSTLSGSYESEVIEVTPGGFVVRSPKGARVTVRGARVRSNEPKQHQRTPLERPANYDMAPGVAVPKDPPGRDEPYLDFVRSKRCCVCSRPAPSEAHHYGRGSGAGGTGMKCDDLRTVPLCTFDHRHFHDHGHIIGHTPEGTHALFLENQVTLLIEWHKKERQEANEETTEERYEDAP